MIIAAKPLSPFLFKCASFVLNRLIKKRFNKMVIKGNTQIKPNHSYLLMCNHFSFWDGFLAYYLFNRVFWGPNKTNRIYIMSLKKQMEMNKWLKYFGSFSVDPGKKSVKESFDYAANLLSTPGNLLLFYPQGKLESLSVRDIQFQEGLKEIVPQIKGDCQIIWSSNLIEYFESTKPSVYFNLLDCGTNHNFDFQNLKQQVNVHHKQSLNSNVRYTTIGLQTPS